MFLFWCFDVSYYLITLLYNNELQFIWVMIHLFINIGVGVR